METKTLSVVTEFVNAVKTLNMEKIGSLLHPAVKWQQPGNNRYSGTMSSSGDVFGMVGSMFEVSKNSMHLAEIKTIAVNGNQASVVLLWKASRPGAELNVENIDVYTVEDDKIVDVRVYTADPAQEDLFWGN